MRRVEARDGYEPPGRGPNSHDHSLPSSNKVCASLLAPTLADWVAPVEVTAEITQILSNFVLGDNAIRQR